MKTIVLLGITNLLFVAMPDGTTDGMVVMELDKLEETVFALLETWDEYEGD